VIRKRRRRAGRISGREKRRKGGMQKKFRERIK